MAGKHNHDTCQEALNQAWQVEERGLEDKAIGMAWLMGADPGDDVTRSGRVEKADLRA